MFKRYLLKGLFISPFFCLAVSHGAEIYQYQDANGKWHFSDRKHAQKKAEVKSLRYQQSDDFQKHPHYFLKKTDNGQQLWVKNPYAGPIYAWLKLTEPERWQKLFAQQSLKLDDNFSQHIGENRFYYVLGEPLNNPELFDYALPFQGKQAIRISQGFNGKFSHNRGQSLFAVDFAADVGTDIVAARAGTVLMVKDNYPMAGTDPFFLDKANRVIVLHDDGTMAVHAHILLGSAAVKLGDAVQQGQKLAEVGSNGFSTGPHLHFVIWYNDKGKQRSLPFWFITSKGKQRPNRPFWISP